MDVIAASTMGPRRSTVSSCGRRGRRPSAPLASAVDPSQPTDRSASPSSPTKATIAESAAVNPASESSPPYRDHRGFPASLTMNRCPPPEPGRVRVGLAGDARGRGATATGACAAAKKTWTPRRLTWTRRPPPRSRRAPPSRGAREEKCASRSPSGFPSPCRIADRRRSRSRLQAAIAASLRSGRAKPHTFRHREKDARHHRRQMGQEQLRRRGRHLRRGPRPQDAAVLPDRRAPRADQARGLKGGKQLTDDVPLADCGLEDLAAKKKKLMMMGSTAEVIKAPEKEITFVEDLPEEEQEAATMANFSPGLTNLGNTCYMNATIQCPYAVPELRSILNDASAAGGGTPASAPAPGGGTALANATRDLFNEIKNSNAAVTPFRFLALLRQLFPQFAQVGQGGVYSQQGRGGVLELHPADALPRGSRRRQTLRPPTEDVA